MIKQPGIPIDFHYLGDRDYVDISQVSKSILARVVEADEVATLDSLEVRVRERIRFSCLLREGRSAEATVQFKIEKDGSERHYHLVQTDRPFGGRLPEPELFRPEDVRLTPTEISVRAALPRIEDQVHLFMRLARMLTTKVYDAPKPRAVKFQYLPKKTSGENALFTFKTAKAPVNEVTFLEAYFNEVFVGRGYLHLNRDAKI